MRAVVVTLVLLPLAAAALAQGTWVGPRPPCDIGAGHFRINSAIVNLKVAVERPNQRDRMLAQAIDVLTRAITQDQQEQNPGAWYYLGRYYVETNDPAGADSAFDRAERLAPQCTEDIKEYRRQVWASVFNDGVRAWQEGNQDSAAILLRIASDLLPSDPRAFLTLGRVWAARDQTDSAIQYLRRGADVAGTDTTFAREHRDALVEIARIHVRRAQADPALQGWQRVRYSRDSLERGIANDSIILGRILASAASRRARGTRLSPADQQIFTRDSTARAQALARGREARTALVQKTAADSAAVSAAFAPAIEAYGALLAAYPTVVDAATTLALLHAQTGRPQEAAAVFDRLLGRAGEIEEAQLFEAGRRLAGGNVFLAATRAYALALERNPFHRDALLDLTNSYVQLRDSAKALAAARRLLAVDPMNRPGIRLMAAAWELQRVPDSTLKYLRLADSAMVVDVAVTSFVTEQGQAVLAATANNVGRTPSRPFRITVEFLDGTGAVQRSQLVDIPAIPPTGSHPFEARAAGQGIRAWRYRPS